MWARTSKIIELIKQSAFMLRLFYEQRAFSRVSLILCFVIGDGRIQVFFNPKLLLVSDAERGITIVEWYSIRTMVHASRLLFTGSLSAFWTATNIPLGQQCSWDIKFFWWKSHFQNLKMVLFFQSYDFPDQKTLVLSATSGYNVWSFIFMKC